MADRRMLNRIVTNSDAFVDMPFSSQALYVHLNMEADDDGFVNNPKTIAKNLKVKQKDLDLLIEKNFLISFKSGVVAITHWKINNIIRSDRKKETIFKQELNQLCTNINGFYELLTTTLQPNAANCQPTDNQMATKCPQIDNHFATTLQPVDNPINIINLNNINKEKENIKEEINKEEKKQITYVLEPLPFTQHLLENGIIENDQMQIATINSSIKYYKARDIDEAILKNTANEILKELVNKGFKGTEASDYFSERFDKKIQEVTEHENG